MPLPSSQQQVEFLLGVQRLLNEGRFTATYKFALIHALADLAVERGNDLGDPLRLTAKDLAGKFLQSYWRQARPYLSAPVKGDPLTTSIAPLARTTKSDALILAQNSGKQADILNQIVDARSKSKDGRLSSIDASAAQVLASGLAVTIQKMPLWKLQTVGSGTREIFYKQIGSGSNIELLGTAVVGFRIFHGLITDMIRGAWLRFVQRINQEQLGQFLGLEEFMFGSERQSIESYRPILLEAQSDLCFYCQKRLREAGELDHFIAWARYPLDILPNLVLTHKTCNSAKSDRLAAVPHLERWCGHLDHCQSHLSPVQQVDLSRSVAQWAYQQAESSQALVWQAKETLVPLSGSWRGVLGRCA